ncbi:hypothetical protein [Streptomyces sp. NPDC055107]
MASTLVRPADAHNGVEATVPAMELTASGGVPAAAGLALCRGRHRGAAVAQSALTAAPMTWPLSSYGWRPAPPSRRRTPSRPG